MIIIKHSIVTLLYKIYSLDKKLLYSSEDSGHIVFKQETGRIMKGIEAAVHGKEKGFKYSGIINANDAFGEYKADYVIPYHKSHFSHLSNISAGDYISFNKHNCRSQEMMVLSVDNETVVCDANHEQAGNDIFIELEVLDVEEPLKELIDSGCGGCKH